MSFPNRRMLGDTPYDMFVQEYVARNRPYNGVVFVNTGGKKIMLKIKYVSCDEQTAVTDAYGYLKPEFEDTLFRLRNFDYSIAHPAVSTRVHINHFAHSSRSENDWRPSQTNLGRAGDFMSFGGRTAETYRNLGGERSGRLYHNSSSPATLRTRRGGALTSTTIPAVANYAGRFADAAKIYDLGVSFVNDGITLDNSMKLCFVALEKVLFKALAAAGMKTGGWIIAGAYLITDIAVEEITGKSIQKHAVTRAERFRDEFRQTMQFLQESIMGPLMERLAPPSEFDDNDAPVSINWIPRR